MGGAVCDKGIADCGMWICGLEGRGEQRGRGVDRGAGARALAGCLIQDGSVCGARCLFGSCQVAQVPARFPLRVAFERGGLR